MRASALAVAVVLWAGAVRGYKVRHTVTNLTWAEICGLEGRRAARLPLSTGGLRRDGSGRVGNQRCDRAVVGAPIRAQAKLFKVLLNKNATGATVAAMMDLTANRVQDSLRQRGVLCGAADAAEAEADAGCVARPVACPAHCATAAPDDTGPCVYAQFASAASQALAARLGTDRLCLEACVPDRFLAMAANADKLKDQEFGASSCSTFHLHALISSIFLSQATLWQEKRRAKVFVGRAEVERALAQANLTVKNYVVNDKDLPKAQTHQRCAVIGSGHSLACANWGLSLEEAYDAVFRVNPVQGAPAVRKVHACQMGARTDYHVRPDPKMFAKSDAAAAPGGGGWLVAKNWADWLDINRRGRKALMPTATVLRHEGHGGSGMGSGSSALAIAVALCKSVDAFGFGVYRGLDDSFSYIHFYDTEPWLGDNKGGELVFSAELRNALFDAVGIANFVWW